MCVVFWTSDHMHLRESLVLDSGFMTPPILGTMVETFKSEDVLLLLRSNGVYVHLFIMNISYIMYCA